MSVGDDRNGEQRQPPQGQAADPSAPSRQRPVNDRLEDRQDRPPSDADRDRHDDR
jgi:hypothetical protein